MSHLVKELPKNKTKLSKYAGWNLEAKSGGQISPNTMR